MPETPAGWGLVAAVVLFAAFLVVKSLVSLRPEDPARARARRRIAEAKRRARGAGADRRARARAWLVAADIALEELDNPGLAASYARRAGRADPEDPAPVSLVARALRKSRRLRTLERFLWRRLQVTGSGPAYEHAFDELLHLYEGPLRRPERAAALRSMRAAA